MKIKILSILLCLVLLLNILPAIPAANVQIEEKQPDLNRFPFSYTFLCGKITDLERARDFTGPKGITIKCKAVNVYYRTVRWKETYFGIGRDLSDGFLPDGEVIILFRFHNWILLELDAIFYGLITKNYICGFYRYYDWD